MVGGLFFLLFPYAWPSTTYVVGDRGLMSGVHSAIYARYTGLRSLGSIRLALRLTSGCLASCYIFYFMIPADWYCTCNALLSFTFAGGPAIVLLLSFFPGHFVAEKRYHYNKYTPVLETNIVQTLPSPPTSPNMRLYAQSSEPTLPHPAPPTRPLPHLTARPHTMPPQRRLATP